MVSVRIKENALIAPNALITGRFSGISISYRLCSNFGVVSGSANGTIMIVILVSMMIPPDDVAWTTKKYSSSERTPVTRICPLPGTRRNGNKLVSELEKVVPDVSSFDNVSTTKN